MESVPSNTGSFAERRKLFKDIWDSTDTSKDNVNLQKPTVIRTARVGEQDIIGKRKKQRIRHLRSVCKKILHFCDREENDIFGPMATARTERQIEDFFKTFKPPLESLSGEVEDQGKKPKSAISSSSYLSEPNDGTNRRRNEFESRYSGNSTQNKINRNTNTNTIKTSFAQGNKPKSVGNFYAKSKPAPRQLCTMHTINIPRIL
ncbi:uncharacterized protein [Battus philenor]|uniref:uncharacterized protein n=1 Tax=Battus philenor TaxID=42288 RepID=UPI0035D043AB